MLFSSRDLGWQGISVETRLHAGGEFQQEPSSNPWLSFHLGAPIWLEYGEEQGRMTRHQVELGSTIVVSAEQPSLWRHSDPSHFLNINLSGVLLESMRQRLGLEPIDSLIQASPKPFHDPHLGQIALLLRWEMEAGAPYGNLYAETLAEALCVHLLQRGQGQIRTQTPIAAPPPAKLLRVEMKQAVDFIEDNLATELSVDAIARECRMSTHHFAHVFTQLLGISPHQYVIQARIERAKTLISREGLLPITIAQTVGFSDQSHFTRHFKRLVGVTPRVFSQNTKRRNIPAKAQE